MTITALPLAQRLRSAVRMLTDPPSAPGWNHDELKDLPGFSTRQPAAVLVPVVLRDSGLTVLFTRRTEQLSQHAGQVSFPGGRIEASDRDAVAAALRETCEEVGIARELVQPFGFLDCFETVSNFCITPVVGFVDAGYCATPDPGEVAEVFEVPLSFFLVPENLRHLQVDYHGQSRHVFEFAHPGQHIWGVTAAILLNLVRRMGVMQ